MLSGLTRGERMRLMKFVCAFVWADLKVETREREFVTELILRLALDGGEASQVQRWLEVPPRPEEIDPSEVPNAHRQLFLDVVRQLVSSDDEVNQDERETLALLAALLEEHAR
jgi:hypothetical protein